MNDKIILKAAKVLRKGLLSKSYLYKIFEILLLIIRDLAKNKETMQPRHKMHLHAVYDISDGFRRSNFLGIFRFKRLITEWSLNS